MKWSASIALLSVAGCFYDFSNPPTRISTECLGAGAGSPCDDGDLCSENDSCDGLGACRGTTKLCNDSPQPECVDNDTTYRTYGLGQCRPSDGACDYVYQDLACPSCEQNCLNPCLTLQCPPLADGCLLATCEPGPPASCAYAGVDDDTACVREGKDGLCRDSECLLTCAAPTDCDDGDPCTDDTCVNLFCAYTFNTADCDTCGVCDGDGTCVYDDSQDADCGDPVCGFCASLGTCGRADAGVDCATCMDCDSTGHCNVPTPADQPGPFCTGADTVCSMIDWCDGAGQCLPRHRDQTVACDTCMMCDGAGECALPIENGLPGPGCTTPGNSCSAADVCDGNGECVAGDFDLGIDCGICGACDGSGTCVYDDTQDADCGNNTTCGSCSSLGTCSFASNTVLCGSSCLRCNGAGSCDPVPVGQRGGCTACQTCNAGGTCAQLGNGSQGECPTCQQCNSGGACVNRANGQAPGCNANCRTCTSGSCTGHEWICQGWTDPACQSSCNQTTCNTCCWNAPCQ